MLIMNIKTLASLMNKTLKFCSFMRSKFSHLIHVIRNVISYFLGLESWCEKNNMVKKWYISERLSLESLIVFWHCSYWYCRKFSSYLMKWVRLLVTCRPRQGHGPLPSRVLEWRQSWSWKIPVANFKSNFCYVKDID